MARMRTVKMGRLLLTTSPSPKNEQMVYVFEMGDMPKIKQDGQQNAVLTAVYTAQSLSFRFNRPALQNQTQIVKLVR